MMNEYKVMDDGIYKETQCGENVYLQDIVMPKETFIEAFDKYIRFQPTGMIVCMDCLHTFSSEDGHDICPFCKSTNIEPTYRDVLGNLNNKIKAWI